jgi:hypothetical protein
MGMSNVLCARRQGPSTKEVSKVQQGCLARGETEADQVGLGMSRALSRASWLTAWTQPRGGNVQQGCLAQKPVHTLLVRIVYTK